MFTGIVQAIGVVHSNANGRLVVGLPDEEFSSGMAIGESIAVNGCCLTLVTLQPLDKKDIPGLGSTVGQNPPPVTRHPSLAFDLSDETTRRTSLSSLGVGSKVNLERAMSVGDRFGGHIVQGHVDAVGELVRIEPSEHGTVFRFRAPAEYDRYLIDKGSITIDGISLTVVEPEGGEFDVWIIPHTLSQTNLQGTKAGDRVNMEFDMIAKYVERLLKSDS